jgi:rhodanese-related sulfurtransferase
MAARRNRRTYVGGRFCVGREAIMKGAKELVAEASTGLQTLSAEDALKLMGDPNVTFVDVREQDELQRTGKLRGALHVPRGLLEFQVDPTSPTHKPELGGEKKLVLYCGSGGRSALGTKALKQMGMMNVAHVAGGFPALQKAGAPREEATL